MRCIDCEYNGSCSVQEIAPDITGCEGHSKPRKLKPNECMCTCCKKIFDENSGSTVSLTLIFVCGVRRFSLMAKEINACAGRMVQCISYCYCCG